MAFSFEQVKEVMKFHEESMVRFFMTHVERLEKRIDDVTSENTLLKLKAAEIEKSLSFSGEVIEKKNKNEYDTNNTTKAAFDEVWKKLYDIEDRSRRNNLRMVGLTEDNGEDWDRTEAKVKEFIKTKLGIEKCEIERAHRTGSKKYKDGKPNDQRPIVVKFLNYKDKNKVLNEYRERKLWNEKFYINEDFSDYTNGKRKYLFSRAKEEKGRGRLTKVVYDKLYVRENAGVEWRICY
jgi:regulator of replication initiation timing